MGGKGVDDKEVEDGVDGKGVGVGVGGRGLDDVGGIGVGDKAWDIGCFRFRRQKALQGNHPFCICDKVGIFPFLFGNLERPGQGGHLQHQRQHLNREMIFCYQIVLTYCE